MGKASRWYGLTMQQAKDRGGSLLMAWNRAEENKEELHGLRDIEVKAILANYMQDAYAFERGGWEAVTALEKRRKEEAKDKVKPFTDNSNKPNIYKEDKSSMYEDWA